MRSCSPRWRCTGRPGKSSWPRWECSVSNRDPFSDFSERIALAAVGGKLATSRTQKGWDFTDTEGRRVQVRYLANPGDRWVNEHLVDFRGDGCDSYALVIFEAFDAKALLTFDHEHLAEVCNALGKRHPGQEDVLALTRRNYNAIVNDPARFASLGVSVLDLTSGPELEPEPEF